MYQIALCDDEIKELDKVESMFADYCKMHRGCDFSIKRFIDADELLDMARKKKYLPEILFMDIYMPGKLGIQVAQELRELGSRCRIVFLTTSTEHALDAFGVDADQYLVKPVLEQNLFSVLDKLIEIVNKEQKKYLSLRIDNKFHRIAVSDIVFCEAQKKYQCIHLADGTSHILRMTMAKVFDMLSIYREFAKVGISFVVNLDHVDCLSARELQMDNGEKVYLPRGSYQSLRERYFAYYCEEE